MLDQVIIDARCFEQNTCALVSTAAGPDGTGGDVGMGLGLSLGMGMGVGLSVDTSSQGESMLASHESTPDAKRARKAGRELMGGQRKGKEEMSPTRVMQVITELTAEVKGLSHQILEMERAREQREIQRHEQLLQVLDRFLGRSPLSTTADFTA
jgi:hypothetical protein